MQLPHIFAGTLREHYLMLFGAAGIFAMFSGFAGAWVGSWLTARKIERSLKTLAELQAARMDAVQHSTMMQAIDAISLEVERISEAQRFTSKLLVERNGQMMPALREAKSITPH